MEHRWGTRQPGEQRGNLHASDATVVEIAIVDLSISGALLRTVARPPLFSVVRLTLSHRANVSLEAQVVRHTDSGCAIEWRTLGDSAVMTLLQSHGAPDGSKRREGAHRSSATRHR
jgi:hypothetical protein